MEFATHANCKAVVAVGTCSSYGGIPAARGSVTGARGLVSTGPISGGYTKVNTQGFWDYLKDNYLGGYVNSIAVTYGGSNYVTAPTVTITGGGGSGASATAVLGSGPTAGTVVSIVVTTAGLSYETAPTITFSAPPGGGTFPTATAILGFDADTGIDTATWNNLMGKTICVPGCPPHPDWIVGTIVYWLTYQDVPLMDKYRRPLDFYGEYQCTNCLWQTNNPSKTGLKDIKDNQQNIWAKGGTSTKGNSPLLYKNKYNSIYEGCIGVLGCKGRKTKADCSYRRWNSDAKDGNGVGWCVQTRAGCHGCTDPRYPDGWGKFFSYK